MITLIKAELFKTRHAKRWLGLLILITAALLYMASHYFTLYATPNPNNLAIYQQGRILIASNYRNQYAKLEEYIASDDTAMIESYTTSTNALKNDLNNYLQLEQALIKEDWVAANQLLYEIENTYGQDSASNQLTRQYLIANQIPTIQLSAVKTGTISGFWAYATNSYLWLVCLITALLCGFDIIAAERKQKSLKTSLIQPFKRSRILIAKIIVRSLMAGILMLTAFGIVTIILHIDHTEGSYLMPVIYSPLALGQSGFNFFDVAIMPLYLYLLLTFVHVITAMTFVILLCGATAIFIRWGIINLTVHLIGFGSLQKALALHLLPKLITYTPWFYLYYGTTSYETNDITSIFFYYRQASLTTGLLSTGLFTVIITTVIAFIYDRKDNVL